MALLQQAQTINSDDVLDSACDFQGFSNSTLLEVAAIPIPEIAMLALREGQCTNPLYRVHRWFARRLGSQFRAILTGLSLKPDESNRFWDMYLGEIPLEGATVLDPFVGGGTSLIEAERCGARVIGFDIDPVATFITRFELEARTLDPKAPEIDSVCESVSAKMAPFHRTTIPGVGERVVLHHFWVELRKCSACRTPFEIHPHYQLAYSKEKGLQWVFCKDCHEVYELPIGRKEIRCDCGAHTRIAQGTLSQGKVHCPTCGKISGLGDRGDDPTRPEWKLFAQEYLEKSSNGIMRCFKKATKGDRNRYGRARRFLGETEKKFGSFAPYRAIPQVGRSDNRPLIHGFVRYQDLFNDRQLLHLTLLGQAIENVEGTKERRLLGMAFSEHLTTNCMYTAYAFGYRRISPMFSIHSYRHITRPVEINPWLQGIGRGTFPNVLGKIAKAVTFAKEPTELDPNGGRQASRQNRTATPEVSGYPWKVLGGSSRASIVTRTSEDLQGIPDKSIDLILTDPPYFDNISYSELSDFYLAWHQSLGIAEPPYNDSSKSSPIKANLALSNHTKESIGAYKKGLKRIFEECHRVLKNNGVCVFTYHHKALSAWLAVGEALARSGFACTAALPLRGEGKGGLHSYKGTIKWDAVFVCRKTKLKWPTDIGDVVVSRDSIEKATKRANDFTEQLVSHKEIGFQEPDRLNLQRALVVASAVTVMGTNFGIPLRAALEEIQNNGETTHA